MGFRNSIVDRAVAAALDALPQRLNHREMAAAAGVSLWSLQRAFATLGATPVAHIQQLCLERARRDLEKGAPGDTVFGIACRWGFTSPDGAFRDGYRALFGERPSDALRRARRPRPLRTHPAQADDHIACLECGRKMRRLRRHVAVAHGLSASEYRDRWGLDHNDPLVCAELSRDSSTRARATGLAGKGALARRKVKGRNDVARHERIDGDALPTRTLVARAERLVLAALPDRLSEVYLAKRLGVGLRTLRRCFLEERGQTVYVALRCLRLREALRRLDAEICATPDEAARQCGFGHFARFRRDLDALRGISKAVPRSVPAHDRARAMQPIVKTRIRNGSSREPQRAVV